jgi:hypothetical protein
MKSCQAIAVTHWPSSDSRMMIPACALTSEVGHLLEKGSGALG